CDVVQADVADVGDGERVGDGVAGVDLAVTVDVDRLARGLDQLERRPRLGGGHRGGVLGTLHRVAVGVGARRGRDVGDRTGGHVGTGHRVRLGGGAQRLLAGGKGLGVAGDLDAVQLRVHDADPAD